MKNEHKISYLEERIQLLESEIEKLTKENRLLSEKQGIQNTILEKSLGGYYILLEREFRLINPIIASYTGYAQEEIIGKPADFLIHPEDKESVKKNAFAMKTGSLVIPYEYRIVTRQNEIRWVLEVVASITFEGKQAVLGSAMDITQQKMTEKKLMESENLYRTIFETTGTATVIIEDDKTLSLINSEFEKVTGYKIKDWEGKRTWVDLIDERDRSRLEEYHRLRRIDPELAPRTYEFRLVDSQGNIKNMLSANCLIPGTRKHVCSVIDITELEEKGSELLVKTHKLEELNTALRVMLKQRAEDREELEQTLMSSIKELIMPNLGKLRKAGSEQSRQIYHDLIASNLEEMFSPFSRKLSNRFRSLTTTEIQVAHLIKDGKNSKEIADVLSVSSSAVDVYRYRIRKKMGINNQKVNLRSYLLSLP
ncbi:MAG: PAS domain S-box protein [Smithellaceae bacterium]|nr:PAS domain S-box protein [Syntrophaceae bacterium]MDD4240691.1 PAS domain S-box protein [Smithellaceae bacterium]NLX52802.1 PAS domain S-box protein [Deltaproteobacteria bacterium]